jgi:pyridoxamine 5'-phosphate oxidase
MAAHLRPERSLGSLEDDGAQANPLDLFAEWLQRAIDSVPGEPNAMTLATATVEGKVSARMVLLRGFDESGFVFYTNYESRKGRDLDENPYASLVFYWGVLQRQVCIAGRVERVSQEQSQAYFKSRPRGHQIGAWTSPQSQIIDSRAELERRAHEFEERFKDEAVPLPPFWGGFRVVPDYIEFWQGRPNRLHDRLRYSRSESGEWTRDRLAP